MKRTVVLVLLGMMLMAAIFAAMPARGMQSAPEDMETDAPASFIEDGVRFHYMTSEEMLSLRQKVGVRDPSIDYNIIIDGFGTGLAPPTEEQWQDMVGKVKMVEDAPGDSPGLPAAYDLSAQSYFPKVGNQRSQGSCGSWASIYYAYGYLEAKDNGWTDAKAGTNASHLMSPAWAYNMVNGGTDSGSWMTENFQIAVDWGIASLATHPYNEYDDVGWGGPAAFREAPLHKASTYQEHYYAGDEAVSQTKAWIAADNPVTFTIDAYEYDFDNGNCIVTSVEYDSSKLNHAQTVVGYNDTITEDGEVGAFRVVNSWGTGFGQAGYYWITYAAFKEISNRAGLYLTTVVDVPDYAPSLLATWHFNTAPKRSADLTLAVGSYPTAVKSVIPYFSYDSVNDLPAFMCLDVSSFRNNFDAGASAYWMKVDNGGTASLDSLKLESYEGGYVPGASTQASAQSSEVPKALPGHASLAFFKYVSISASAALDYPGTTFTGTGQARWTPVNHTSYYGGSSMQSGDVGDGFASSLQTTAISSGVSFYWKVSSQSMKDYLRFYVDGTLMESASGQVDWSKKSFTFPTGNHVLRWDYVRDADNCGLADTAWVDKVVIMPADDAREENDDPGMAALLDPVGEYPGLVGLDDDWYKVRIETYDALTVGLDLNSSEGDLDLFLYAPDGATLLESSETSGDAEEAWLLATSTGYYYVLVRPDMGQFSRYSLTFLYDPGALDYGKNSSLVAISGTGAFSSMTDKSVTVEAGSSIDGSITLRATATWPGTENLPLMATSNWGDNSTSYWGVAADLASGTADYVASISVTAPAEPGTYALIFAFRNESSYQYVASGTDDAVGAPAWDDGNDIASFSPSQIDECRTNGRTLGNWLRIDGLHTVRIPSDAIIVHVIPIDTVAPVTAASWSGTAGQDGWFRSAVMVTLSATDAGGSGVKETWYRVDLGTWTGYTAPFPITGSSVHSLEYYSTDEKDNVELTRFHSVKIDLGLPSTSASFSGTLGLDSWYVSAPQLTLAASDSLSGVQFSYYRVDGTSWRTYGTWATVAVDGQHTVEYYSVDVAGNAESAKQTSVKVDRNAPISSVDLVGVEGSGGWYAGEVGVSIAASDAASGLSSIRFRLDQGDWATYDGAFHVGEEGEHLLQFNATDNAGNQEGMQNLTFMIDSTAPETSALVSGEEGLGGWYVSATGVELSAVDALSGVLRTEWSLDGGLWTTYSSELSIATSGEHVLLFRSVDVAGMQEDIQELVIWVDVAPPECELGVTGASGSEGWYISAILLEPTSSDQGSGVETILFRLDGGSWSVMPQQMTLDQEGDHLIECYAIDYAGNVGETRSTGVSLDTSAPLTSLTPIGSQGENGWFVSLVDVDLIASDNVSGVGAIYYSVEGAAWHQYTYQFSLESEGVHHIRYYSVDLAGNAQEIMSMEVKVELTAPQSLLLLDGEQGEGHWYVSSVEGTLLATDPLSGVSMTYYRLDGAHWQDLDGTFLIQDGKHQLDFYSVDMAGNQEVFQGREVWVDGQAPTTLATTAGESGSSGWFVSQTTTTLLASDGMSGVNRTLYQLDEGDWTEYSAPLALDEGVHELCFLSNDLAGNEGMLCNLTIMVDTSAPMSQPAFEGGLGAGGWFITMVNVTLSSEDATSGLQLLEWKLDGGAWSSYQGKVPVNVSGRHLLEYRSVDVAGNLEPVGLESFKMDLVPPTFQVNGTGKPFTTGKVTIAFTSEDEGSSVSEVTLRLDNGTYFTRPGDARTVDLGDLEDGWHELEVIITDEAGNSYSDVISFKVDTNPFSPEGPFGPWLLIGLAALVLVAFALIIPIRQRKKKG